MQENSSRILVGVDFSPSSELAVAHAAQLAARLKARLDLVYIHTPIVIAVPEMVVAPPQESEALAEAERNLRELAARYPGLSVGTHVSIGDPITGLLALIDELKPDFAVVGSHGRGALMRILLGSVAESLLRRSPVPVFVVPAKERAAALKEARK